MTPRVPAKANIKQWNEEQWPGRSRQSRVTTRTFSLFPFLSVLPPSFFPSDESRTTPHHAVLPGLQQALWLVLIGIIVWYETKPLLCLSSYSYHGVTGWHTDSTEILQRAEHWKLIQAQHSGSNPRMTSKLLDTVCCVLSTQHNHCYSRVVSCLVQWISNNSLMAL